MKYQKSKPSQKLSRTLLSKKLPVFAYVVLLFYISIFFGSVWFSSYQNQLAVQMHNDFEQRKNTLLDEIHQLELEEAELTSIDRIRKIAKDLEMVQPSSKQVQILLDNHEKEQ